MPVEEIYKDNGISIILAALQKPMEQKLVYQKRRFLHVFKVLRKFSGESICVFTSRNSNVASVACDQLV